MKILRTIAIVVFILSATASVNAGVGNMVSVTNVQQVRFPPHPPAPHISLSHRRPAHRRVVSHRRPVIKLPHIKLPPHPRGGPPRPPGL